MGNFGGVSDGGRGNKDNDEEFKDSKGDDDEAYVDSFLRKIVKGYSHRPKLETDLSDTRKKQTKALKREVETISFLESLPKCLWDVEKASLPL